MRLTSSNIMITAYVSQAFAYAKRLNLYVIVNIDAKLVLSERKVGISYKLYVYFYCSLV